MTDPRLLDAGFAKTYQESLLRDAGVDTRRPTPHPVAEARPPLATPGLRSWSQRLTRALSLLRFW
ncbi:MAG: hypothetical protein IMX00_01165 [Limnochordales bacterium]|nr:hypothetical protein [Limnochordales bacterium]